MAVKCVLVVGNNRNPFRTRKRGLSNWAWIVVIVRRGTVMVEPNLFPQPGGGVGNDRNPFIGP
jgi:hypothetical protein